MEQSRGKTIQGRAPFRVRFAAPLTVIPIIAGVATAIPLWGTHGEPDFFLAATHVIAIGAVALALQGRFFRLRAHLEGGVSGAYAILNVVSILAAIGVGLGFAFSALAIGKSADSHVALTAGALATIVAAFAVQALFGTPGVGAEDN